MEQTKMTLALTKPAVLLTALSSILFSFVSLAAPQKEFSADLTASIGRSLSPEAPKSTLGLEPTLTFRPTEKDRYQLYLALEKELSQYESFHVPKLLAGYRHSLSLFSSLNTGLNLSSTGIDLDRWKYDGVMVKNAASFELGLPLTSFLTLTGRLGPFVQINQYNQRSSGAALNRYGLTERLTAAIRVGRFALDFDVIFEQAMAAVWKNALATREALTFDVSDNIALGVAHELVSSVIDGSTGRYRSLRVFDSRESQVSAMMAVSL